MTTALIYQQLSRTEHHDLKRDVEMAAIAFAHQRATWALVSLAERRELDAARTRAHDAFIDACNILSRAMRASNEDATWRDTLGHDRKRLGDFACYVTLHLSLSAR